MGEFYKQLAAENASIEIIFVSSDQDDSSFDHYFQEQPWTAVPFDNEDLRAKLGSTFGVRGIPSFIILNGESKSRSGISFTLKQLVVQPF